VNRSEALQSDNDRIIKKVTDLYSKSKRTLESSASKEIAKTPEYKHLRNKGVGRDAAIGAGLTSLIAATRKTGLKKGLLAGGAGAAAGAIAGMAQSRKALNRQSNKLVKAEVGDILNNEIKRNRLLHDYVAQPGTQRVNVGRPWGEEKYEG
jgi:hypothetical protein